MYDFLNFISEILHEPSHILCINTLNLRIVRYNKIGVWLKYLAVSLIRPFYRLGLSANIPGLSFMAFRIVFYSRCFLCFIVVKVYC